MAERPREVGDFKKARVNGWTNNHLLCFMSVSVCMFALSTLRLTKFIIKEFYYY